MTHITRTKPTFPKSTWERGDLTPPNIPDYENDLVFPPASADVRTTTIEKYERLKKQLFIATCALENYANEMNWFNIYEEDGDDSEEHIEALYFVDYGYKTAQQALEQIKELDR